MKTEDQYLQQIDEAIVRAARHMNLEDLDPENEEEYETEWEARFHCGTCSVRAVMEQVWPSIEEYTEALKKGQVDVSAG